MKLNSQQSKDFVRALTSEQGKALALYFDGVKMHFALDQVKRKEFSEFERGRTAGVIDTLEMFTAEVQKANKILEDEPKTKAKQDEMEDDTMVDFQSVYNKANSLKS